MLDIKLKLRPGHTSERAWLEPSPLRQLFWNITYACNYRAGGKRACPSSPRCRCARHHYLRWRAVHA